MIADMESNEKLRPLVTEFFLREKKKIFELHSYQNLI